MLHRWAMALLCLALGLPGGVSAGEAEVREALAKMRPQAKVETIAPVAGAAFYEAVLDGQIVYVSADGQHFISGEMWRVNDRSNLTAQRKNALRRAALAAVGPERRIVFAAERPKYTVTVLTDIDCGYCRRLHKDIAQYNALGITVEYILYPRGGQNSASFNKAVSVWCAADRKQAFTLAKSGQEPEAKRCDNKLTENYPLGARVGLTGTPMVVAPNGETKGYLPPERMLAWLEQTKSP